MTVRTIPLGPTERQLVAEHWNQLPGMRHLGARADFSDPAAVRVSIDQLQPYHRGGLGTEAVNGAVIAGLCDAVIGMVGHFQAPGRRVGTAQLNVQFLRPLYGERVTAVGRLLRAGASLVFVSAEVEDARGQVCSRGDGIVMILAEGADDATL